MSSAEPREPVNVQEPSHRAPASHGHPFARPRRRSEPPPPGFGSRRGEGWESKGRKWGWARPETTAVPAPHLQSLRPEPPAPTVCATITPRPQHPQSSTAPRPQPPIPPSQAPNPAPAPPAPDGPETRQPAPPTPNPKIPSPKPHLPAPPAPGCRAPPGPAAPSYSPAAPVAAAGRAGALLRIAVLLQGCGREGVEEAGGQRRPAEAAARPGQKQSQLHLARPPAGTRSPGREDSRERTDGRTEPAAPAESRASAPVSERSPGPSWKCLGGAHASQGRLFKFGEVGSAPSKGAWGFLINPRRSGAEEAAVAAELGFLLRWGSGEPRAPKARSCAWVPKHTLFRTFPTKPSSGRKCLRSTHSVSGKFTWAMLFNPYSTALYIRWCRSIFQRYKLRLKKVKQKKYTLLVQGSFDQTIAHPDFPRILSPFHLQPLPCQLSL